MVAGTAFLAKVPEPDARRDQARPRRQPLPLRHLRPDLRGRAGRGEGEEGVGHGAGEKRQGTLVTFTVKAGLPPTPQPMEVDVAVGDIKPWDVDSWAQFEQMGKPRPRFEAPLKVTGRAKYTYDVKLPGMLYGRMIGAEVPAGEILSIDTSKAEALPGGQGGLDGRLPDRPLRRPGRGRGGRGLARDRGGRGPPREGRLQGEALHPRAARGHEGRRPARLRPRQEPGRQGRPPEGQRGRARRRGRRQPRRRREGLRRGRGRRTRGRTTRRCTPTPASRPTASWPRGRATSSPSTPRRRASSRCARVSPRRSASTARTCASSASTWAAASAASSAPPRAAARSRWSRAGWRRRPGRPVKLMLDRKQEQLCTGNAPSALITVKIGAKKDGTLTAVHYKSYGSGGVAGGAGTAGPAGVAPRQEPELQGRGVRRLHERGPAGAAARPRPLAGGLRHRVRDRRAGRQARHGPARAAEEERVEPGARRPSTTRGEGDRLGATQQEGRRHVDGRPRPAEGGEEARDRHGERQLVRLRLRELERPGQGPPRRLGGARDRLPGHRHRLPHRDDGGGGRGAGHRARGRHDAPRRHPVPARAPRSGGSVTINSMAPVVRLAANQARTKLFELAAPLLGAKPEELDAANGKIFVAKDRRSRSPSSRPRRR